MPALPKGLPACGAARSRTRQPGGENTRVLLRSLILLRLFLFALLLLLRLGRLGLRLGLRLRLWLRPGRRLHLALDLGGRLLHLGPRLYARLWLLLHLGPRLYARLRLRLWLGLG